MTRSLPHLRRSLRGLLAAALLAALLASCGGAGGTQSAATPTAKAKPTHSAKPTKKPSPKPKPKPKPTKTGTPPTAHGGGTVTLAFVDVGQGDGIVLKAGVWSALIDGGSAGNEGAIAGELSALGISRLSALVVTHPHEDHIGDLASIVRRYRPRVAYSDATATTACYARLRASLRSAGTLVRHAYRGQRLRFGTLVAQVLGPGTYMAPDLNADSIVLLLRIDGKGVLLTGDCTGADEAAVGAACARGPPLYLLKVAHHGSAYSTGSSFLSETRPRYAVISVGPNSYGHPSPSTLARLRAHGVQTYTTWKNGTITVRFAASGAVKWHFTGSSSPVKAGGGSGSGGSGSSGTSTAGSSTGANPTVYITATGECYHLKGCRYLAHSCIPIKLKDAEAQGYRACSVCNPPR